MSEIGPEIENLRTAWGWAMAQSKIDEMDRSLESLAEFYRIRAWFQEGEETLARAAQRLAEVQAATGDRKARLVLGKVLLKQGRFCHSIGLVEKASEALERSLVILRDLGARREVAYALCYLGDFVSWRGGEGKSLHQEALAISRDIGDPRGIALSLSGLGSDATGKGDYRAAKRLLQESLALFRELGNREGITQALGYLGYIDWLLGEYGEAEQLYRESLMLSSEVGDQKGIADALNCLALAGGGLEEHEQAKQMWLESLAISKEIGDLLGVETVLGNLAEFANYRGEYAEAIQLAQECLTTSRKIDEPSGIAWALRVLGDAACGLGDLPGAKRYHHQALQVVATIRQPFYIPRHLVGIAALLAAEGESERALELLAMFSHHPTTWHWMKHYRAKPLVAALEAELPPDVVAAARERGRARDLDATVAELLDELAGTDTDSPDQPAGTS